MKREYWEIAPKLLKQIKKEAWSIESMEGHGAGGRQVTYVGSETSGYLDNDPKNGELIFDYYQDNMGEYWFKNRALLPTGNIVSMEFYIFGKERKKYTRSIKRKG